LKAGRIPNDHLPKDFQSGEITKMSSNTQKLRVLHARTDHDLLILVQRGIDRGVTLLDAASSRNSPLFVQAEKTLAMATTLLPKIAGLSVDDRLRIESRVKELRARLDLAPVNANLRNFPATVAS
jgi:hypothetical protein